MGLFVYPGAQGNVPPIPSSIGPPKYRYCYIVVDNGTTVMLHNICYVRMLVVSVGNEWVHWGYPPCGARRHMDLMCTSRISVQVTHVCVHTHSCTDAPTYTYICTRTHTHNT